MDGMTYLQMSAADQAKVRKEMFIQAQLILRNSGLGRQESRMAARKMVREALAKERNGNPEGSNTQQLAN